MLKKYVSHAWKIELKKIFKKTANVCDHGCVNNFFCILSADKQQFFYIINVYHFYQVTYIQAKYS